MKVTLGDAASGQDCVVDAARSLERGKATGRGGLHALVTKAKLFSFRRGAFFTGAHLLAFQGLCPWSLVLPEGFTYANANLLAGNAMTASVVGAVLMSALVYVLSHVGVSRGPQAPVDFCVSASGQDSASGQNWASGQRVC